MRVNIIGCAPGCANAPCGEGERWGINDNHTVLDDIDVVIDCHNLSRVMHGKEELGRRSLEEVKKHLKGVKKKNIKMYTTRTLKNIPSSVEYPLETIIKKWGSDYFGSGVDYAIALAVYQGFTDIHMYGVLMIVGEEYYLQKPTIDHWIGVAIGAGCKFTIHDNTPQHLSSIMKTPNLKLYGYNIPQRLDLYAAGQTENN